MTLNIFKNFLKDERGTASFEIIALSGALAFAAATVVTLDGGAFGDNTEVSEEVYVQTCTNEVEVRKEGSIIFTSAPKPACK